MVSSARRRRALRGCNAAFLISSLYPLRYPSRTISELAEHNCLGYTLSSVTGVDQWVFGAKGDVTAHVGGNLRANNGEALRTAAIAGQGLAYLPTFIVADDM